jgi:hypothetical protein
MHVATSSCFSNNKQPDGRPNTRMQSRYQNVPEYFLPVSSRCCHGMPYVHVAYLQWSNREASKDQPIPTKVCEYQTNNILSCLYSFPKARSTHTSQRILPCVRPLTAISEITGVVLIPTASLPHRFRGMQYGEPGELFVQNFPLGRSPNLLTVPSGTFKASLCQEKYLLLLCFGLCLERLCRRQFKHLSLLTLGCKARNECQTGNSSSEHDQFAAALEL